MGRLLAILIAVAVAAPAGLFAGGACCCADRFAMVDGADRQTDRDAVATDENAHSCCSEKAEPEPAPENDHRPCRGGDCDCQFRCCFGATKAPTATLSQQPPMPSATFRSRIATGGVGDASPPHLMSLTRPPRHLTTA
ncbi:MAG: hypothetical protein CMJ31_08325 [Phycisphaerae bacterium]|nr:hypothetical protein [Phycisphaerae bacterium]